MDLGFQFQDRVRLYSALLAICFCGVLLLSSQSAASLATYVLAVSMLCTARAWKDVFNCPMIWPVVAVLLYFTASALWSEKFTYRGLASISIRALLTFCFVVALAECQLRGLFQTWLTWMFGWTGAAVALLCVFSFYSYPPVDGRLNGMGQLDTQVVAALVFGFTLLLVLHAVLQRTSTYPAFFWGAIGLLGLAVVLTGSRNALLSVLYGSFLLILAHRIDSPGRFVGIAASVAGVAVVLVGLAWLDADIRALVFPRGDSFRLAIWSAALERLSHTSWFGVGILSSDDFVINGLLFQHPHNLYLSAAFQGGLIGLTLFLWLIVRVFRELLRSYSQLDAKLALGIWGMALPAYLLDGHELLDKISDTWFLVWLPVAIALGLRWHPGYR